MHKFNLKYAILVTTCLFFLLLLVHQNGFLQAKFASDPKHGYFHNSKFPRHIWQVWHQAPYLTDMTATWMTKNPRHQYSLVTFPSSEGLLENGLIEHPEYASTFEFFKQLTQMITKSDMLRYIILRQLGGFYSDTDTQCIIPIQNWIPPNFNENDISVVLGIEVDEIDASEERRKDWGWPKTFCFSQYAIYAKPHHPIFTYMLNHIQSALRAISIEKGKPLDTLRLNNSEVLDVTGPGGFTNAVMQHLTIATGRKVTERDFAYIKQPKQIADVLVLPINAFGGDQRHSGSTPNNNGTDHLLRHAFHAGWRNIND